MNHDETSENRSAADFSRPDDQLLRTAIQEVALPPGLRERLSARLSLAAADESPTTGGRAVICEVSKVGSAEGKLGGGNAARLSSPSAHRWIALAVAASLVGVMLGLYQFSRPYSAQFLTEHCLTALRSLEQAEGNWLTDNVDASELDLLLPQLQANIRLAGVQTLDAGPLADECRVWKLDSMAMQRHFYVIDFRSAKSVDRLTRKLQSLRQVSGGWTLFAMREDNRLLVVAFRGPVDKYIHRGQAV